jgi:hypothetical protein
MEANLDSLVDKWLEKTENRCFRRTHDGVSCVICAAPVTFKDRKGSSRLFEHLKSAKHIRAGVLASSVTPIARSLENANESDTVNAFNYELFLLFVSSNIPLNNLSASRFQTFFRKHANQQVEYAKNPEKYISFGFMKITEEINRRLQSVPYAIYIDETQDARKRKVVNTIVIPLTGKPEQPMLYDTDFVDSANTLTLSGIVNRTAMSISKDPNLFRLLVTDQCRTNIAAGRELKIFYKNFVHITCLAHGLHLLCEFIRDQFPKVNTLVSKMKSVLTYSKERTDMYQELLGDRPLPPKPVITRWGTFLNTAIHHHQNFERIKVFVSRIDARAADSIALKSIVEDADLEVQLQEIARFSSLPRAIEKLECRSITIDNQLAIYRSLKMCLTDPYASRLKEIFGNNPDFDKLDMLVQRDVEVFKYAILSNAEVERSFSMYKNLLSDRRHRLTEINLKRYLSIQFNSEILFDE